MNGEAFFALDADKSGNTSLLPRDHQNLISDNLPRKLSLRRRSGEKKGVKSSKGKPVGSDRLLSDADLASALAVAGSA